MAITLMVRLPEPHAKQVLIKQHPAKRKVVCAGRRAGKTTLAAEVAIEKMLEGRRVLLSSTTQDQTDAFWDKCKEWLKPMIDRGIVEKNETRRILTFATSGGRIKAKTAWDADSLRGDYADFLVLDECAMLDPKAWDEVAAPMLLDNDGEAWFISTPRRRNNWFYGLYKRAEADGVRWKEFHFTSYDNPHLSASALADITKDLTREAIKQEILAEFLDDALGALWNYVLLDANRVNSAPPLKRIVIAVDPATTSGEDSDETGIIVAGIAFDEQVYVLEDLSGKYSPDTWARKVAAAYARHKADRIVAETNQGGDMVVSTLRTVDHNLPVKKIHAARAKVVRAEPVAALYEQGRAHHAGSFTVLEDQLTSWTPGEKSPDRLDALVYAVSELAVAGKVIETAW